MALSRFSVVLLALLAASDPAAAQDVTTLKKDMIGQWELATTERSKTCVVTLKSDATPQGFKLELEPACAAALPFTKDITGWSIKGLGDIVRLHNAAGEAVIDFTEVEAGIFEGMRTLAANVAVEMPESEVGGTHYRVLFLAALVLLMFTFVMNTLAELIRQRLRGKYASL